MTSFNVRLENDDGTRVSKKQPLNLISQQNGDITPSTHLHNIIPTKNGIRDV